MLLPLFVSAFFVIIEVVVKSRRECSDFISSQHHHKHHHRAVLMQRWNEKRVAAGVGEGGKSDGRVRWGEDSCFWGQLRA